MRLFALLLSAAVVLVACGGSGSSGAGDGPEESRFDQPFTDVEAYPAVVSSELLVGTNRVLIAMFDENDAPVGGPEAKMHVEFFDLAKSESDPVSAADAAWVWAVPGERGLWEVPDVKLDAAGKWGASVSVHGGGIEEDDLGVGFVVNEKGTTPAIGAAAPASDTPTASDVKKLSEITSDPKPDPRFYETSIAGAIAKHEPFVVVFATPKYCTSQVCGPTLDVVKRISEDWPDITFIHVEVYDLSDVSSLKPVPAMTQWGLPGEPWVFVVDSKGDVAAKYEGVVSPPELKDDLQELH
jgi:hypothetical protein